LGKLANQRKKEEQEKKKIRLIKAGGGNHHKLSEEFQIILMLIYLRQNPSFQMLGLLFQVSESTAHNLFNYWLEIFQNELPESLLEQLKKSPEELEKVLEELSQHELIVDTAEQAIQRPRDYKQQQNYYSGKQKRHTFKNQFIVLPLGRDIVDVVVGKPGPMSDIKICRQVLKIFKPQQSLSGDKAYVGEPQISTPSKKPKKGELTKLQKQENKALSSKRIFVEHLIRVVKIFKVVQNRFPLYKRRYQDIILTVCGLVRLRIEALILEIIEDEKLGQVINVVISHSFVPKLDFVT